MGAFAEESARHYQFTREAMDAYAIESLRRARAAVEGRSLRQRDHPGDHHRPARASETVGADEQPLKADPSKIPTLKPAFAKDGAITAANASSISDGAAALVITRASVAERLGLSPIARITGHAAHAHEPGLFTTAPAPAMRRALALGGLEKIDDVSTCSEVNEAFAVVAMIAMLQELAIPHEKLNVNGGACALGHPIGASGARILATLLSALEARGQKRGLASLCIGGGEAVAMAVELF